VGLGRYLLPGRPLGEMGPLSAAPRSAGAGPELARGAPGSQPGASWVCSSAPPLADGSCYRLQPTNRFHPTV
jgi:hypothetical protein